MKRKILLFFLLMLSFKAFSRVCVPEAQGLACMDRMNGHNLFSMLHAKQPAHTIIKTGAPYTITKPGSYQILENIENAPITISANDVILDLNNFTTYVATGNVITISEGVENVVIKNGSLQGTTNTAGIFISQGVRDVRIDNLVISDCFLGIGFDGIEESPVECCKVTNCFITGGQDGVQMEYANKNIFKDVEVCDCSKRAFDLEFCDFNKFVQCKAVRVGPASSSEHAVGFAALGGKDNLFYECMAEGVYKEGDNDWCTKAMGFWFGFDGDDIPETESKIINCTVDSITGAGFANAFGINLETRLLDNILSVTFRKFSDDNINDVDWSPQGEFIALACQDGTARVLAFDGIGRLVEVHQQTPNGQAVTAVEWSPDGQHLAVGTEGAILEVSTALTGTCDGFNCDPTEEVNIEFLGIPDEELFVYRFDRTVLTLVDSKNVGETQVPVYSTLATLLTFNAAGVLQGTFPLTINLPGECPCFDGNPYGLVDDNFFVHVPTPAGTAPLPDNVLRIIWSRDGRHLFVTTAGVVTFPITGNPTTPYNYSYLDATGGQERPKLINYFFDQNSLTSVRRRTFSDDTTNTSQALAITPDDKFVVYGRSEAGMFYVSKFIPFSGTTDVLSGSLAAPPEGLLVDYSIPMGADWNPIACCEKYYLAVVGNYIESVPRAGEFEIFEYNAKTNTLQRMYNEAVNPGYASAVKWAPNGKGLVFTDILFGADTEQVRRYEFDPEETPVVDNLETYDLALTGTDLFVDWQECAKHIVVVGENADPNVEILEVGDSVTKNVVENNKIANVCGGICGIGIIGGGGCNLIDQNVLFGSGVNASAGVFNTYYDFKFTNTTFKSKALDNLAFGNFCCDVCC